MPKQLASGQDNMYLIRAAQYFHSGGVGKFQGGPDYEFLELYRYAS